MIDELVVVAIGDVYGFSIFLLKIIFCEVGVSSVFEVFSFSPSGVGFPDIVEYGEDLMEEVVFLRNFFIFLSELMSWSIMVRCWRRFS